MPTDAAAPFDLNGDGWRDLAIGVPGEAVADTEGVFLQGAGQVHVVFGAKGGVGREDVVIHAGGQRGATAAIGPKFMAGFGSTITSGDFNADGVAELVVGSPDEDSSNPDVGKVRVYKRIDGKFGLVEEWVNAFYQSSAYPLGHPAEKGEHFGESLTVGDFNRDGYPDLAIGAPDATVDGKSRAGLVVVRYGSARGLYDGTSVAPQRLEVWDERSFVGLGSPGASTDARFGAAITTGDINGDRTDDLVVGISGQPVSGEYQAGAVRVIYGATATGLTSTGSQELNLDSPGIRGVAESRLGGDYPNESPGEYGDRFGAAVAAADFDGDGYDDIAVGAPDKEIISADRVEFHGSVSIIYGSAGGLTQRDQFFTLDTDGVPGRVGRDDGQFGGALTARDFTGNGRADLAVAAVGDPRSWVDPAYGSVTVFYGDSTGLKARRSQRLTQATSGIPGRNEYGDMFGRSILATKAIGDRHWDLIIAAPGENLGSAGDAGSLTFIAGGPKHLRPAVSKLLTENTVGIKDASEPADQFGSLTGSRRATDYFGATQ